MKIKVDINRHSLEMLEETLATVLDNTRIEQAHGDSEEGYKDYFEGMIDALEICLKTVRELNNFQIEAEFTREKERENDKR